MTIYEHQPVNGVAVAQLIRFCFDATVRILCNQNPYVLPRTYRVRIRARKARHLFTSAVHAILVVEDNAGILDLAVRHLESLGYRTISAADGVSALAVIKSGAPIDLLFTNVVMPGGLDGRGLAAEARHLL